MRHEIPAAGGCPVRILKLDDVDLIFWRTNFGHSPVKHKEGWKQVAWNASKLSKKIDCLLVKGAFKQQYKRAYSMCFSMRGQ